ncbi:MAG: metallophosphoesterase [Clostridia bacterium]|nr:metallophosphoesterase [Clostridia bacterium]
MKIIKNKALWLVMAFYTSVLALLYSSARVSYYFIDRDSVKGLSVGLLVLMIAVFVLQLFTFLRGKNLREKHLKALFIAAIVFNVIFTAVVIAYAVMGWEMWDDYAYYIRISLPYFLIIWFGVASILLLPFLKGKMKAIGSAVLCVCLLFGIVVIAFKPFHFQFAAQPTVFVKSEDTYSVVWATNAPSTGELVIESGGTTQHLYDENAGNLRTNDCVHHISVPMSVLNNCSRYKVISTRVKERTGYSLWSGKTIESEDYSFQAVKDDEENLNIWSLSDWHEHASLAQKAVADFPKADVLIACGDELNMVNDQKGVIEHLLAPCAQFTHSSIPVIFVRGNHECRGDYASELMSDLGLNSFYYTFRLGSLGGVVLDMGEGNADDFIEYWSLADYEAYRDEQEKFLETLKLPKTKYRFAISHDERFEANMSSEDSDNPRRDRSGIVTYLNRMGIDLLVAGHLHESIVRPTGENGREFVSFVDGGINKENVYSAGLIEINGKTMTLSTVDSNGKTVLTQEVALNNK